MSAVSSIQSGPVIRIGYTDGTEFALKVYEMRARTAAELEALIVAQLPDFLVHVNDLATYDISLRYSPHPGVRVRETVEKLPERDRGDAVKVRAALEAEHEAEATRRRAHEWWASDATREPPPDDDGRVR